MKKTYITLFLLIMLCLLFTLAEAETITIINVDKVNIRNEQGQSLGRVGCYTPVTVGETKGDSTYVTVLRAYLEISQDNYELDDFINKYSGDISGWVKTRCLTEVDENMDQVIRKAEEYRWEFWVDGIYHEIKNDSVVKNKSYETHNTPTVNMVPIDSRFLRNSSASSIYNRITKAQKENPSYSDSQQEQPNQSGTQNTQPNQSGGNGGEGAINLNDYVRIKYGWVNTAGRVSISFDREQFLLDNMKKIEYNYENYRAYQEYYGVYNYRSAATSFLRFISVALSPHEGHLSNGDQVNTIWTVDEKSINNYFVLDYKYSSQTYTVSNLPEPEAVDPFEGLRLEIWGSSSHPATAYLYHGSAPFSGYEITPYENLKNGDTITIKINYDSKQSMIEQYGKYPSRDVMEYTISGIGEDFTNYVFIIHTSN